MWVSITFHYIWDRVLFSTPELRINNDNGHAHRTPISDHAQSLPTDRHTHRTIGHTRHAQTSEQLIHIIVHLPNLLPGHPRPKKFHGHPTWRSCLGEGCCQPQWMAWLCSCCPVALGWANILYSINGQCDPRGGHPRYSSRNTLASRDLSASLTEMPTSWASFLVAVAFAGWLS